MISILEHILLIELSNACGVCCLLAARKSSQMNTLWFLFVLGPHTASMAVMRPDLFVVFSFV